MAPTKGTSVLRNVRRILQKEHQSTNWNRVGVERAHSQWKERIFATRPIMFNIWTCTSSTWLCVERIWQMRFKKKIFRF